MNKKALVTGIGVVSPLGIGVENFWANLLDGKSGIGPISYFDVSGFNSKLGAEVKEFSPEDYIGKKGLRYLNNGTRFLSSSVKMALDDSKFPEDEALFDNIGIIIGTSLGNFAGTTDYFHEIIRESPADVSPMKSFDVALNSSTNHASVFFKIKKFARTISSGFTSGTDAIGDGLKMIREGRAKAVIVGGVELISIDLYYIFNSLKLLSHANGNSQELSAPFDKRRNGFVLGEGSYVLMLEDSDFAEERGAIAYCELAGYGTTLGANRKFSVERKIKKAETAMNMALEDAGVDKRQIDLICANANSSKEMDMIEAKAIRNLFYQNGSNKSLINSIKASVGECYGAAGAAQTVSTAMSIKYGNVPPIINYKVSDPECDLNLVTGSAAKHSVNTAIVNSFDYLGNSSCLLLRNSD